MKAESEHEQRDFELKAFGADGVNGFRKNTFEQATGRLDPFAKVMR